MTHLTHFSRTSKEEEEEEEEEEGQVRSVAHTHTDRELPLPLPSFLPSSLPLPLRDCLKNLVKPFSWLLKEYEKNRQGFVMMRWEQQQ